MSLFIGKKTSQDSTTVTLVQSMTSKRCGVFSIPGINDRHPPCWRYPEFAQDVALDEAQYSTARILDPETEVDVLSDEARAVLDGILSKLDAGPVSASMSVALKKKKEKNQKLMLSQYQGYKPIVLSAYDIGGLVLKQVSLGTSSLHVMHAYDIIPCKAIVIALEFEHIYFPVLQRLKLVVRI